MILDEYQCRANSVVSLFRVIVATCICDTYKLSINGGKISFKNFVFALRLNKGMRSVR